MKRKAWLTATLHMAAHLTAGSRVRGDEKAQYLSPLLILTPVPLHSLGFSFSDPSFVLPVSSSSMVRSLPTTDCKCRRSIPPCVPLHHHSGQPMTARRCFPSFFLRFRPRTGRGSKPSKNIHRATISFGSSKSTSELRFCKMKNDFVPKKMSRSRKD